MGSTSIQQPNPPTPPSVQSSIRDWVQNYPDVFALQQKYAPLEAAQQVQLAQQYAGQLGQAYKTAQEAMYPEETAITKALNQQVLSGMTSDVPDWMRDEYLSNLRANLGTNIGSPIAADYTSRGLLQQKQDWQNYYRDLGLSITGRQPISTATAPQTSNYMAGFTPNSVMSYNMQGYSPYVSAFTNMYNTNAQLSQQSSPWLNAVAGGVGQLGGMASYGLGKKWGWW
jgi:hypothetical protein